MHPNTQARPELLLYHCGVKFQFPSNGKVQPNWRSSCIRPHRDSRVSIPFKREGTAKLALVDTSQTTGTVFQFPSNGKVQQNTVSGFRTSMSNLGFNSLQTGRYSKTSYRVGSVFARRAGCRASPLCKVSIPFKREGTAKHRGAVKSLQQLTGSFNSLQTGRCSKTSCGYHRKRTPD